jgi:hypothetical protein
VLIDGDSELDAATGKRRPKFHVELPGNPILGDGKSVFTRSVSRAKDKEKDKDKQSNSKSDESSSGSSSSRSRRNHESGGTNAGASLQPFGIMIC